MGKHHRDPEFDEAMRKAKAYNKLVNDETKKVVKVYNALTGKKEVRGKRVENPVPPNCRKQKYRKRQYEKGFYQISLWTEKQGFDPLVHRHLPVRVHKKNIGIFSTDKKAETFVNKFINMLHDQKGKGSITPEFYTDLLSVINIFRGGR